VQLELGTNFEVLVADAVFLIRLRNVPDAHDIRAAMGVVQTHPAFQGRYAIVWVLTEGIRGFDRSLLTVHRHAGRDVLPVFMGIVAWHRMQRAVIRTMSAGLEVAIGVGLRVFADEASAMNAARVALE
jgi:hypothetical protein